MIRDVESSIHVSKNWFIGEKFLSEGMRPGETKHGKRGDWEKEKNTCNKEPPFVHFCVRCSE